MHQFAVNIFFYIKINFYFKYFYISKLLATKKSYSSICNEIIGECDSYSGLICRGTNGSKTCQ